MKASMPQRLRVFTLLNNKFLMARFQVYNASAGAGKTFSLVKNYLRICLAEGNPKKFMQVLAITFTNKAANEMKERIVSSLYEFAHPPQGTPPGMLRQLAEEMQTEPGILQQRADEALKAILHNYSAFSVSTIDKFTNRLIRSFAQDLKLSANYEVAIDGNEMLNEAVERLLSSLQEDQPAASVLTEFVERQLREGKSPRPEAGLVEMGKNLFQERALNHINRLKGKSLEELIASKNKLFAERAQLEKEVSNLACDLQELVSRSGLEKSDFNRGVVYNYLAYCSESDIKKWSPGKMVVDVLEGEEFYSKSKAKTHAAKFAPVESELREGLKNLAGKVKENLPRIWVLNAILKEIYSLIVLSEIDRSLQEIKEESNRLPIGEFNKLISERLRDEPSEYLYEKIGERYRNFFIDEFQDTSLLQWQNLIPLVNNAMAADGTAMIVGDGKQSIYRWRGGEVSQFLGLSTGEDTSNLIMSGQGLVQLYERETLNLPSNYRSRKNIVDFNNRFFTCCAPQLEKPEHVQLFEQAKQQPTAGENGYVKVQLLDYDSGQREEYQQAQCREVYRIVQDALRRGFRLRDVTVLVRNHHGGSLVAEYLLSKGVDVISSDSLELGQSREVQMLVSFLRMLHRPDHYENRLELLHYVYEHFAEHREHPDLYLFQSTHLREEQDKLLGFLKELIPGFEPDRIAQSPLLDIVLYLQNILELKHQNDIYLQTFTDKVYDHALRNDGQLSSFIRWWDQRGAGQKIQLPASTNAVQIMTIHKSKGLQFKVSILAFADWLAARERDPATWVELEEETYHGLPTARIGISKAEDLNDSIGLQEIYETNKHDVLLDNLNLLYVALTRAVDELYVLSAEGMKTGHIPDYFRHFMQENEMEGNSFEFGEPVKMKAPEQVALELKPAPFAYRLAQWTERLAVAADAPRNWQGSESGETAYGKKLHSLLAEVKYASDIDLVVQQQLHRGNLKPEEQEELRALLLKVVEHPDLKDLFSEASEIFNERELLLPAGKSLRPDRVVILNGKAHIIDYKTGVQREEHRQQVEDYRKYLNEMNLAPGRNMLVYLKHEPEILSW